VVPRFILKWLSIFLSFRLLSSVSDTNIRAFKAGCLQESHAVAGGDGCACSAMASFSSLQEGTPSVDLVPSTSCWQQSSRDSVSDFGGGGGTGSYLRLWPPWRVCSAVLEVR